MTFPASIGRYRLVRRIASGGMGEVYLGVLEAPGGVRRLAAVKFLLESRGELCGALLGEARLAALLSHPNVVQLLDAGIDAGRAWFAMEYVAGLSLAETFEIDGGRVPPWTWVRIIADACAAVHAVHEARDEKGAPLQIVHRDVTPHNLLVGWDGFVKLVDFGIARSTLHSTLTTTGVVKGKLGYLSPEQASGGTLDRRTDVFALGILLWEALARKRLFRRGTDSETIAAIVRCDVPALSVVAESAPPVLAPILERALTADPSVRYSTALEMQRALERALVSSDIVVGANEVAHVLASIAPGRVREHHGWLAESASSDVPRASNVVPSRRRFASWALAAGVAAVSLALVLFAPWRGVSRVSTAPPDSSAENGGRSAELTPPSNAAATAATSKAALVVPAATSAPPNLRSPPAAASAPAGTIASRPAAPAAPSSRTPARGRGTLQLSSWPNWAAIRIDGISHGSTPLVVRDLASGSHSIEARQLGREPAQKRTVNLAADAVEHVEFRFPE